MNYIILFLLSFGVSFCLTLLVKKLALKLKILDKPGGLKTHTEPVPYLGGVSIYFGCIIGWLASYALFEEQEFSAWRFGVLLTSSGLILLLGLLDDLFSFSPLTKFLGQLAIAGMVILCGVRIEFIKTLWLSIPLTLLWLVGLTNAFNLIDILDGLAVGVAAVASFGFFVLGLQTPKTHSVALLALVLGGATSGFFKFNFPRAEIFMGDAGSQFIGFTLGIIALSGRYCEINRLGYLVPVILLGVPIYETFFLMIIRKLKHIPVFRGSPDHIALRMVKLGLTQETVVLLLWTLSVCLAICGFIITKLKMPLSTMIIYIGLGGLAVIIGIKLARVKV
jgi:UDP-GlcNAc:undecaprenyl-phosphate GlcNAc-1-phosphate transferase